MSTFRITATYLLVIHVLIHSRQRQRTIQLNGQCMFITLDECWRQFTNCLIGNYHLSAVLLFFFVVINLLTAPFTVKWSILLILFVHVWIKLMFAFRSLPWRWIYFLQKIFELMPNKFHIESKKNKNCLHCHQKCLQWSIFWTNSINQAEFFRYWFTN